MRRQFIAGNWKMNLDTASVIALAGELQGQLSGEQVFDKVDVAVCPPFVYLPAVCKVLVSRMFILNPAGLLRARSAWICLRMWDVIILLSDIQSVGTSWEKKMN